MKVPGFLSIIIVVIFTVITLHCAYKAYHWYNSIIVSKPNLRKIEKELSKLDSNPIHQSLKNTYGLPITKAVIWGHKLGTHTHSYIHYAFYKTFKHLGFKTYWLDKDDDISHLDLSQALFITEGQVDQNIPLRDDCFYILHYIKDNKKYTHLMDIGHCIHLFPYKKEYAAHFKNKLDNYIYYDADIKSIYMPWATDLLPFEIDAIKNELPTIKK